jgi:hypothetical protein
MAVSNYYRSDGWVKTTLGPAIPGAQVYVCFQPANVTPPVTPPRTTPVPWQGPNPQAPIFSDNGLTPITQPIITDGFGHYDFYVLPGLYTVVIMYNGVVQEVLVDQSIGNVGSSGGAAVALETNGSPNFNQNLLNLVQGSGITLFSDNFGNTTISGTVAPIPPEALPQPDTARFAYWSVANTSPTIAGPWATLLDIQNSNTGGGGGANVVVYTAATATANTALTFDTNGPNATSYNGTPLFFPTRTTTFKTAVQAHFDINAVGGRYIAGLSNVAASVVNDPTTGDCIAVAIYKAAGLAFGNLQLVCAIGGTTTIVDSGIPASDATGTVGIRYEVELTLEAGVVTMYVNGVDVATCSTNVPSANPLGLVWFMGTTNASPDGTLFIKTEYLYAETLNP